MKKLNFLKAAILLVVGLSGCADAKPKNIPAASCVDLEMYKPESKENIIVLCNGTDVKHYLIGYMPDKKIARWTVEKIKPPFQSGNRTNDFHEDTMLPKQVRSTLKEYKDGSDKFDRGHLVPAGDQPKGTGLEYKQSMSETFVLSNMVPQFSSFNRGSWQSSVEAAVRNYSVRNPDREIVVITGTDKDAGLIGSVTIPKYMWKLAYDETTKKSWAYYLENAPTTKVDKIYQKQDLETFTGLKFKNIQ